MTTYYRAAFISELNDPDGHIADCVWTSGLRQANAASGGKHPATLAEAEALRAEVGGSTSAGAISAQLIAATTKRYAWAATVVGTPTGIIAAAKPGQNVTISGHLSNFPAGHRLRRFSPLFTGGHRIDVDVEDGPRYWWVDPLAPQGSGYTGEYVTVAELATFARGGSGGTVAPLRVLPPTRKLRCAAPLRATTTRTGQILASLPAGTVCTVLGTVTGEAWAFWCGLPRAGTSWLHIEAAGKTGFVAAGRF